MNITIELSDTQLSEMISRGIKQVDNETLRAIARKALEKCFSTPEMAEKLVMEKEYYGNNLKLRDWVTSGLSSVITPDDFAEYKKKMMEIIEKNGRDMVIEALARTLTSNLFTCDNRSNFMESLVGRMRSEMER